MRGTAEVALRHPSPAMFDFSAPVFALYYFSLSFSYLCVCVIGGKDKSGGRWRKEGWKRRGFVMERKCAMERSGVL